MSLTALTIGLVAFALAGNVVGQENQRECGDFDYGEQPTQLVIPSENILEDLGNCDVLVVNAIVDGDLSWGFGTIEHGLTFSDVRITGSADFRGATFEGVADFRGATFEGVVGFDETTFKGVADFAGTTFEGGVGFFGTTFKGTAFFGETTFEGSADFGKPGYGGPCPPGGTHRYFFKLYALDAILDLPQNASKQMVEQKMEGHIIDQSRLTGQYNRE